MLISTAHSSLRQAFCAFKNDQQHRLNNKQISEEIKRISCLITRRLFAFRNPKDTWNALKQLTGGGVILVVRRESGSTPVLIDSWNKSVKTAESSLAAYLRARLERPS